MTRSASEFVSVILPVHNAEDYFGQAIESVLAQTYPFFEFIIVDDGSTDRTPEIARQFALRDRRIRIIRTENGGISNASNTGARAARHRWLAIMHADDVAMPDRLAKQLRLLQANPGLVACGTYAYHTGAAGKFAGISRTGPRTIREFMALREAGRDIFVIHSSAVLDRKTFLEAGGYDPSFRTGEDIELFDRMATYGPILVVPEPLMLRRIHERSNTMRSFFQMRLVTTYVRERRRRWSRKREWLTLESYEASLAEQPLVRRIQRGVVDLSQFCYHLAGIHFVHGRRIRASGHFILAMLANPLYALPRVWHQYISFKLFPKHGLSASSKSMAR